MSVMDQYPDFWMKSAETVEILAAYDHEVQLLRGKVRELLEQCNVATATWGLTQWERQLGLETEIEKPLDYRRSRVTAKLRGTGTVTVAMIQNVAESFSNGTVEVLEDAGNYHFDIKFVGTIGIPPNMDDLTAAINEIKPAHLTYCVQYSVSLLAAAQELVKAGCVVALNYDGGGSSQCDFGGNRLTSVRTVHNYLCIWTQAKQTSPSEKEEPNLQYKICVDAGHGGTCSNGSPDGTYLEHEFTLDVAGRIEAHLERHGVAVIQTRTGSTDVSLAERCRISNAAKADYFVSVHTNAAAGTGWQSPSGWEAVIVAKGGKAEQLAQRLKEAATATMGCEVRPTKVNPGLKVLNSTDCPAVIVEYGFHTNRADVEKLKDNAYRDKCAMATAQGVLAQLGIAWKAPAPEPQPPTWADEHCKWVREQGIADGQRPGDTATRGEVFAMLHRLAEGGGTQ